MVLHPGSTLKALGDLLKSADHKASSSRNCNTRQCHPRPCLPPRSWWGWNLIDQRGTRRHLSDSSLVRASEATQEVMEAQILVVHRLTCSMACGIFLDQGLNLCLCIGRWTLNHWTTREVLKHFYIVTQKLLLLFLSSHNVIYLLYYLEY